MEHLIAYVIGLLGSVWSHLEKSQSLFGDGTRIRVWWPCGELDHVACLVPKQHLPRALAGYDGTQLNWNQLRLCTVAAIHKMALRKSQAVIILCGNVSNDRQGDEGAESQQLTLLEELCDSLGCRVSLLICKIHGISVGAGVVIHGVPRSSRSFFLVASRIASRFASLFAALLLFSFPFSLAVVV